MKKIFRNIFIVLMALSMAGCDSYFETDPSDIINSEDYIGAQSEMYSGYLGIISKMQAVGDKVIFASDLRMNFMEPTVDAPEEMWQLYNYNVTPSNKLADPAEFYAVIIAVNDYLDRMFDYKEKLGGSMDAATETNFNALVSGAVRIKAWTYFQLAKIYGKAYYFDDPITELKSVADLSGYQELSSFETIVDKCLEMIDGGYNGIPGDLEMNWGSWLDPENPTNAAYVGWNYITPDYLCLRCELLLSTDAPDYAWIKDNVLNRLLEAFAIDLYRFSLNAGWSSNYYRIFAEGTYYSRSSISSIIYDYTNNQTNDLITYFGKRYPAQYLIRPSTYGMSKYNSDDRRGLPCNFLIQDGDTVIGKYHSSYRWRQPYQSDASIPLYRGHDLHFWLAEAENHLGHWDPAKTLLNEGVSNRFTSQAIFYNNSDPEQWDIRYANFYSNSYNNIGICGVVSATQHELSVPEDESGWMDADRIKEYDLALLDEMLLEFPSEGRVMSMLYRMAQRYDDMSIIADRVVPKYPAAQQDAIRDKILGGEYFINWNY